MNGKNYIRFSTVTLHIRVWMHQVYLDECVGQYIPRLGGWS